MNDKLKKIIEQSSFEIKDGTYVYTKVATKPNEDHFMISQDKDEITVITTGDKLGVLDLIGRNKICPIWSG